MPTTHLTTEEAAEQITRHDLWDWDLPAAPSLVTIRRNGKPVDAVAQLTKFGYVYVLDRKTGEPLFPVEERRVLAVHGGFRRAAHLHRE